MAQKPNVKRPERKEKGERNMNRAVILLIAGLVGEWYLLMADRYYARGTIKQVVAWYNYLGVMRWVGLAVLAAGVAFYVLREKKTWYAPLGESLAGVGAFFAFTSAAMRHVYPTSVTVMCVLVPVLLILGIVYLFYQAEFSVQATALAMSLFAVVLLGRSATMRVKVCAGIAIAGILALLVCTAMLKKKNGVLEKGGTRLRVFPSGMDYRLTFGVLVLCLALVLLAVFAAASSFYSTWALAVVSFVLAVYYTIKLM